MGKVKPSVGVLGTVLSASPGLLVESSQQCCTVGPITAFISQTEMLDPGAMKHLGRATPAP